VKTVPTLVMLYDGRVFAIVVAAFDHKTPDLGLPDQSMATLDVALPPVGIILEHWLEWPGGGARGIIRFHNGGSRWHGVAGSRRRMHVDGCT
jgi:hypothetical protein